MLMVKSRGYIAFIDHRFLREAIGELKRVLGDGCEIKAMLEEQALLIEAQAEPQPVLPGSAPMEFVDSLLRIRSEVPFTGDYLVAAKPLLELIDGSSFALEVKKLGLHSGETAKSIEVILGRSLEGMGASADLHNPELKIYVLLTGTGILLCTSELGGKLAIDRFRAVARSRYAPLNRSELKLMEAVELFGIDIGSVRRCLDIGAAPGGWSNFMLKHGATVVSVDAAFMDYADLESSSTIVVADKPLPQALAQSLPDAKLRSMTFGEASVPGVIESALAGPERGSLVHLVCKAQSAEAQLLSRLGQFDAILCDMNCAPEEAARTLCAMSGLVRRGGVAIMTAKLFNGAAQARADSSMNILGSDYTGFAAKKLPHNRKEITILAFKK